MSKRLRVAVVGCGYWGPNMVRDLSEVPRAEVATVCDLNPERLNWISRRYPSIKTTTEVDSVANDASIGAVVLATPVSAHFSLARKALLAGKHVLVEKPLTEAVREGEELVELADRYRRVLMVDHTFLYTGAVRKLSEFDRRGRDRRSVLAST